MAWLMRTKASMNKLTNATGKQPSHSSSARPKTAPRRFWRAFNERQFLNSNAAKSDRHVCEVGAR
jgi:hypothetical protein